MIKISARFTFVTKSLFVEKIFTAFGLLSRITLNARRF